MTNKLLNVYIGYRYLNNKKIILYIIWHGYIIKTYIISDQWQSYYHILYTNK